MSLFLKNLQTFNFIKKGPQRRCFPVNIAKFLILPILETFANSCFLIFSMVQSYIDLKIKGLNCMTTSGFRVRVARLVFVFKLASLTLKQVPTCIRKPKTKTFDNSIKYLHWLFLVVLDSFRSFSMVLGRFRLF